MQHNSNLSDFDIEKYSRHILIDEIDITGQIAIKNLKVFIFGAGGIGCSLVQSLVYAGVNRVCIADGDTISLSNIQRQVFYNEQNIGQKKTEITKNRILAINPNCNVTVVDDYISANNIAKFMELVQSYDIILDTTDTFATRTLINQLAIMAKKPLISAAAIGFKYQIYGFCGHLYNHPCYNCLFDDIDDTKNCSNSGIFSPAVHISGALLASYTLLSTIGRPLIMKKIVSVDLLLNRFTVSSLEKNPNCKACSNIL